MSSQNAHEERAVTESLMVAAPSNIALIKYMGKNSTLNFPANTSLSYTLNHLKTFVRITPILKDHSDQWRPLIGEGLHPLELSEKSKARYLKHFLMIKEKWRVSQNFLIESANNFPSDCGLASSASSFAALTMAAVKILQKINRTTWGDDPRELSALSRQGSGSSCRSFFSPWAIWEKDYAEPVNCGYIDLLHMVVVVEGGKKMVSSSEAHQRVLTSPFYEGRTERAHLRIQQLMSALRNHQWSTAREICWEEFIDMHQLFETSQPAFSYMTEDTHYVLNYLRNLQNLQNLRNIQGAQEECPIVTMDAGPNVHLLFHPEQKEFFLKIKSELEKKYLIL